MNPIVIFWTCVALAVAGGAGLGSAATIAVLFRGTSKPKPELQFSTDAGTGWASGSSGIDRADPLGVRPRTLSREPDTMDRRAAEFWAAPPPDSHPYGPTRFEFESTVATRPAPWMTMVPAPRS